MFAKWFLQVKIAFYTLAKAIFSCKLYFTCLQEPIYDRKSHFTRFPTVFSPSKKPLQVKNRYLCRHEY